MIIEGCSADVYCDCRLHKYDEPGHESKPAKYFGKSYKEIGKKIERDGWIKVDGKDVCPTCKTYTPILM